MWHLLSLSRVRGRSFVRLHFDCIYMCAIRERIFLFNCRVPVFYLFMLYYCCLCRCYSCRCRFLPFRLSDGLHVVFLLCSSLRLWLIVRRKRKKGKKRKTFCFVILISCKEYTYTHLEWCFLFFLTYFCLLWSVEGREKRSDLSFSKICPFRTILFTTHAREREIFQYLRKREREK